MIHYRKMTAQDVEAVHAIEVESFPTPWTDGFFSLRNERKSLCSLHCSRR